MDILGIGTTQLEIQAFVDEDFPPSIGFHRGTTTEVSDQRVSQILPLLTAPVYMAGGTAVLVAKILSGLGLETGFMGKADSGSTHEYFESRLKEAGVFTGITGEKRSTGLRITLLGSDGTRTVITSAAAAVPLEPGAVPDAVLASTRILYLALDTPPVPGILDVVRRAADFGLLVAIDLSSSETVHADRKETLSLIREYADIVFLTDAGAFALLGKAGPASERESWLCDALIIQRGDQGAVASDGDRTYIAGAIQVLELDRSGESAAFASGFLYGQLMGLTRTLSLDIASMLSAEMRMVPGTELEEKTYTRIRQTARR